MTIDPAQIDYTDVDYASLRRRLINVVTTEIAGWDPVAKHIGNLMLEADAFAFDIAARYQDVQALERFISTCRRRENAEAWAQQLGYDVRSRVAARYVVTVTLNAVPVNDVNIPLGHRFYTSGGSVRVFEAVSSATIPAASDPPTVDVLVEDTTGQEDTESSSGLPDQEFLTSGRPLPETLVLLADDGAYTVQPSFAFSGPTDRHATVRVRDDERLLVRFGNGVLGKIPSGTISMIYRVGGGIAGNVAPGAIKQLDPLTDVLATPVAASCTNAEGPYILGRERETVAEIKQNAPASVRVTDRTVTSDDYNVTAEQVSGVARAKIFTANELPGAIPENHGYLYVVPVDVGTPSQALLDAVLDAVTVVRPNTITFRAITLAAVYNVINLRAVVYFERGAIPSVVVANLRTDLTSFFAPLLPDLTRNETVQFGYDYDADAPAFPLNLLLARVQQFSGVSRVGARADDFLLNGLHADVVLAAYEWPKLGTVTIINGATGQQVP